MCKALGIQFTSLQAFIVWRIAGQASPKACTWPERAGCVTMGLGACGEEAVQPKACCFWVNIAQYLHVHPVNYSWPAPQHIYAPCSACTILILIMMAIACHYASAYYPPPPSNAWSKLYAVLMWTQNNPQITNNAHGKILLLLCMSLAINSCALIIMIIIIIIVDSLLCCVCDLLTNRWCTAVLHSSCELHVVELYTME